MKELRKLTRAEKETQVRKEAKATMILFVICFVINVFAAFFIKNNPDGSGVFLHLPLWWWISVPGMWIIAVAGVVFLLKKVFIDFDLDDSDIAAACEPDESTTGNPANADMMKGGAINE